MRTQGPDRKPVTFPGMSPLPGTPAISKQTGSAPFLQISITFEEWDAMPQTNRELFARFLGIKLQGPVE